MLIFICRFAVSNQRMKKKIEDYKKNQKKNLVIQKIVVTLHCDSETQRLIIHN